MTRPTRRLIVPLAVLALCVPAGAAQAADSPSPGASGRVTRSDAMPRLSDTQQAELLAPGSRQSPAEAGDAKPATAVAKAAAGWNDADPPYACAGYSSIPSTNPLPAVLADTFRWGAYPAVKVGNGKGDVNWRSNPYRQVSWYMWLHSLRWTGAAITAGVDGDSGALDHATAIVRDWVRDNPYSWQSDAGAWESTMHRTNVLLCLRQALAKRAGGTLPASFAWLDQSLLDHAEFMRRHFSGNGNHGTDESIAMIGAGCVLRRPAYVDLASSRLASALPQAIDAEGATNEQSTGYALFNWSLWGRAERALRDCAPTSPAYRLIASRRALLATFMAHAISPLGWTQQIGDTQRAPATPLAGTPQEFAASAGRRGTAPKDRVRVYSAGYVFGRSGWGTGARPFAEESAYTLRFGPARSYHGHADHTSITWQTRGGEILADTGYGEYTRDAWEAFRKSPQAHSVLATSGMTGAATRLTQKVVGRDGSWEAYRLVDAPGPGLTRTRDVVFLRDPDLIVTVDRGTAPATRTFSQLWQLPNGGRISLSPQRTAVTRVAGRTKTTLVQLPYRATSTAPGSGRIVTASTRPIQGWKWLGLFDRRPAPTVTFDRRGRSVALATAVVASDVGARIGVSTTTRAGHILYRFSVGNRIAVVGHSPAGALYRAG